ncbi:MAG: NAD(P)H-dependent glycerol-3-phosphate dehydrogenase [Chlamydiota bacterium]|nr:NAD(P)H-dependent glycerol-3-phosphate dehydrogenase [Chlamydiota bacterium]
MAMEKVVIIGDGGWGTAVAILLCRKGYQVHIWSRFEQYARVMAEKRENIKFLPGIMLPPEIIIETQLETIFSGAILAVNAVPTQYLRDVTRMMKPYYPNDLLLVSLTKGIENDTLYRMSQVLHEELGPSRLAILSGPSHAEEVAKAVPTSVVVSSEKADVASETQSVFNTERFRVYTNADLIGVELGGAMKNVVAIAAGISDGLGYGTNAKAALLARGLVEIARLGCAMGAQAKTFYGLSGLGDLVTTCFSGFSRNRRIGELLGQGMELEKALGSTEMVVEGVKTAKSVYALAEKYQVEMPIAEKIYQVLYEGFSPREGVQQLMVRSPKSEMEEW